MAADGSIHKLPFERQAKIICWKFALGDTKLSTKYSVAGVADRPIHRYVSEAAFKVLSEKAGELLREDGVAHKGSYGKFGIRIEHIIPTEVVYCHLDKFCQPLKELYRQDKKKFYEQKRQKEAYIVKLIKEKLFCALITKEEDALLSKAGLRNKMPEGWSFETGDMLARYRVVGIKMHTF